MKRNNILWVILAISFVAIGCKTVKQAEKTKSEVKTEVNPNVKTEAQSKATIAIKTVATDKGLTDTNTNTKVVVTEFSTPDVNGKQHVTKQTITEQTSSNKKIADSKIDTESKAKTEIKAKQADKSNLKQRTANSGQLTTVAETQTPAFVTILALVSGFIGIALIIYLLKRFKVIK